MSEEIFDVVNDRDEVIGQKSRAEVHRLGLMHRAVHVLVFNSRGQIFLQKRSRTKDRHPGTWDSSSSGHVDAGEHYEKCALRELREEIGLQTAEKLEKLFQLSASLETDQEHVWVFRCYSQGPFALDPGEIDVGGWFEPEDVSSWIAKAGNEFAPAFRLIWAKVQQHGQVI